MDPQKRLQDLPNEWTKEGRSVKKIHLSQQTEAATVLSRAYRFNPVFVSMLPKIEERRVALFENFNVVLGQNTVNSGLLITVITDDSADTDLGDALRGVAIWKLPGAELSWNASVSLKYTITKAFGLSAKIYDYFKIQEHVDLIRQESEKKHNAPCWTLDMMGIDPTCRLKGYGMSMLKPIIEEIDKQNCSSFLATSDQNNIGFFQKLGYAITKEFSYDTHKISCLYRPPIQPPELPLVVPDKGLIDDGLDNALLDDGPYRPGN